MGVFLEDGGEEGEKFRVGSEGLRGDGDGGGGAEGEGCGWWGGGKEGYGVGLGGGRGGWVDVLGGG